jgi:hypothetical protein
MQVHHALAEDPVTAARDILTLKINHLIPPRADHAIDPS